MIDGVVESSRKVYLFADERTKVPLDGASRMSDFRYRQNMPPVVAGVGNVSRSSAKTQSKSGSNSSTWRPGKARQSSIVANMLIFVHSRLP